MHRPRIPATLVAGCAALFAFAFGLGIYCYGASITGPFIFGDEREYFLYGYDLFAGTRLSNQAQYGILYPAVIAIFFHFGDAAGVYQALRAFNVAAFVSSAAPIFLLARLLFPGSGALWLLLSVFAATCPFSGLADLLWADPLYFTLFQWLVLSLFVFFQCPGLIAGCLTGALLGLLFHTKPLAGIVVAIAVFVSLAVFFVTEANRSNRSSMRTGMLAVALVCGALTIPWIIRNLSLGVGPIGYSSNTEEFSNLFAEYFGDRQAGAP